MAPHSLDTRNDNGTADQRAGRAIGVERSEPVRLRFGSRVYGFDGCLGRLADAIVEPAALKVTHIVVKPRRFGLSLEGPRLVPFSLVRTRRGSDTISLACTRSAFGELFALEEAACVPVGTPVAGDDSWDVGVVDALPTNVSGPGELGGDLYPSGYGSLVYDLIPKGQTEVRRLSAVVSKDGFDLGGVHGLITDGEGRMTEVVLSSRRAWHRRRVAIPVSAVRSVDTDEIRTTLTRREAEHLRDRKAERP